jgi:hypothetical protein
MERGQGDEDGAHEWCPVFSATLKGKDMGAVLPNMGRRASGSESTSKTSAAISGENTGAAGSLACSGRMRTLGPSPCLGRDMRAMA